MVMNNTKAVEVRTHAVSAAFRVGASWAKAICGDKIDATHTNTKRVRAETGQLKQFIEISGGKSLRALI